MWSVMRRMIADSNQAYPDMYRRYLQEDDRAVLWHDRHGKRVTIWNFAKRKVTLPGRVRDLTAEKDLPKAGEYMLEPCHTYRIGDAKRMPVKVGD